MDTAEHIRLIFLRGVARGMGLDPERMLPTIHTLARQSRPEPDLARALIRALCKKTTF